MPNRLSRSAAVLALASLLTLRGPFEPPEEFLCGPSGEISTLPLPGASRGEP
jgi:hypothetical protein